MYVVCPVAGKHQFIRSPLEKHSCQTQVNGLQAVVLNPENVTTEGIPVAIACSGRIEHRDTGGSAEECPAGTIFTIIEVVVTSSGDMLLALGIRPVVPGSGLPHRGGIFQQYVTYPSGFVVEPEVEGIHSVREILEAHSRAVIIRDVML